MPAHESLFGSDGLNFELQGTGGVVEVRNSHGEGNWGQGRLSLATSADGGNSRDNTEPGAHRPLTADVSSIGLRLHTERGCVAEWLDLQTALATEEFDADMPAAYRAGSAELEQATQSGHGGSDFFCTATFLAALRGGEGGVGVPAVGIHEAMDMTLPGLCSQLSIAQGGA